MGTLTKGNLHTNGGKPYFFLLPLNDRTIDLIRQTCRQHGLALTHKKENIHITLMKADNHATSEQVVHAMRSLPALYTVSIKSFKVFKSPVDGRMFLMAVLASPELYHAHEKLLSLGFKSAYNNAFEPHITLSDQLTAENEVNVAKANSLLKPTLLTFSHLSVCDVVEKWKG